MIHPIAMGDAHMECRELSETVPVMTDLLAFEKVADLPGAAILKHPNSEWRLVVHEGGPQAPQKQMHNHFGVRVATVKEVDAAYQYLKAHEKEYGIRQIGQPEYSHGSYSLYFLEPGTNGWEIECYETVLRKGSGWNRLGGVRAPHWTEPLPPERFPGRGYVPQAFTHGTLALGDLRTSWNFYANALGLEVHQANDHVVYVKVPASKPYIVCAARKEWKTFSPNFRFALKVASKDEVVKAHRWLATSGAELGVTELSELKENGSASFLVSDPDRNWWEIVAG
ncbi:MAG TPA: VOC family protein [Candidatus Acidoferrales bacterium]|nr:VOC family protein [Candidatus Acidoferrales bacterium]